MKQLLLLIPLTLISLTSIGQAWWGINFDNNSWPLYHDRIVRDTITNTNCLWQVGQPTKTIFTSAYSIPNAILTDTLNPVPANDTSVFYLKHERDNITMPFHAFRLHFWYRMDGDSTDFGTIEISPDTGHTWINVLTQDTTFQMNWFTPKPTFKGSTSGWQSFDLDMMSWASATDTINWPYPILITADTILFRFTYITDSSSVPHDGWIIDDFLLEDWAEGVEEFQNNNLITIFPNPASDKLVIQRTKFSDKSAIQIINYSGQVIYDNQNFIGEAVDTQLLTNGIYLLRYSDSNSFAIMKFVINH